jgi:CubicO group peptidase (beta-lactamase class C family)
MNALLKLNRFTGSVLIARNGRILVSRGYGMANLEDQIANSPQTKFRIASITKQFTAMGILMLQERGKLNVQDEFCRYIVKCPEAWQHITIHQLLTHSSGIPDYHREIPELRQPAPFIPKDQVIEIISRKPLHFIPGEHFRYSNSGYYLLGHIIEKVSGESYGSFLRANIFSPLGMKDTGLDDLTLVLRHRAIGYVRRWDRFLNALFKQTPPAYADAGLYSTVEDLLRWDQALYTERLISEKSLAAMLSPLIRMSITAPWGTFNGNYGYGWIITDQFNHRAQVHGGIADGFTTFIMRFPEDKATIVFLGNLDFAPMDAMARSLTAITFGEKYQMPKQSIAQILFDTTMTEGIEAALKEYRHFKSTRAGHYEFSERELNSLGYDLLNRKRVKEAIEVFKLNVEAYPESFNVYDSLGEAYMVNGNKELAIKNYQKSLELNPQNTNGLDILKRLKQQ